MASAVSVSFTMLVALIAALTWFAFEGLWLAPTPLLR
jgi:ABC-type phosphate transport system auxiliary subunit